MARLFSEHDRFHAHALLGALALANFALRWALLFYLGSAWRLSSEPLPSKLVALGVHAALPLLSLPLPLPRKRNHTAPMIWPEFRLHSLVFSLRHVLTAALAVALPPALARPLQHVAVHTAMLAASAVSARWGDREQRTTNAMPYPAHCRPGEIACVKRSYAYAQLLATAMAISAAPDHAFSPLLAIQLAPLMMTLVRKGKARAATYHFVYACALLMPAIGMMLSSAASVSGARASAHTLVCAAVAHQLRVRRGAPKHATWLAAAAAAAVLERGMAYAVPELVFQAATIGALAYVAKVFAPPRLAAGWWLADRRAYHYEPAGRGHDEHGVSGGKPKACDKSQQAHGSSCAAGAAAE